MSPRRVIYHTWTAADRERLKAFVARNTIFAGKICWAAVAKEFPGRTAKQLKSYYWNVVQHGTEESGSQETDVQAKPEEMCAEPCEPITDLSIDEEITMQFVYLTSGRDERAVQKEYPQYSLA